MRFMLLLKGDPRPDPGDGSGDGPVAGVGAGPDGPAVRQISEIDEMATATDEQRATAHELRDRLTG